jgi:hypothetical protein
MDAPSDDEARARREGKRAAHAVVIVIAVVFVGASAAQIIPAVFGLGIRPVAAAPSVSPERACTDGVRVLARALHRAGGEAWSSGGRGPLLDHDATGGEAALQTLRERLSPEWNTEADIRRACVESREGYEAWAALLRLRRAEEQLVLQGFVDLAALRGDLAAHLPADLQ